MFRKTLIALAIVTLGTALVSADASAQRFRGGGVHRVGVYRGVARGGWRGTGWRGAGWRGGVRVARRSGWAWRAPALASAGVGTGWALANAGAWGSPGWGSLGWGWGGGWNGGWNNVGWNGGCTRWRQIWTGRGWRNVPVNVCW
jgi:hypothetical protein